MAWQKRIKLLKAFVNYAHKTYVLTWQFNEPTKGIILWFPIFIVVRTLW